MNKTNLKRKLALNRETVVRLDPVALDGVNGGGNQNTITITVTVSIWPASHPLFTCK